MIIVSNKKHATQRYGEKPWTWHLAEG